jgi:hypothetical protein
MPDPGQFEKFVVLRLDEAFGLDPKMQEEGHSALRSLAQVFYNWAQTQEARELYGFWVDRSRVFVECPSLAAELEPLDDDSGIRRGAAHTD